MLLVSVVLFSGTVAQAVPPGNADEIRARTAPMGQLCRAGENCGGGSATTAATSGAAGGGVGMTGKQIYDQYCFACHATGVTDAPRFGNADDWAPRIAKGMDTLMLSTINGFNIMPPKGTCMSCSDDELRSAVHYMAGTTE
jgi:cytochrome c5